MADPATSKHHNDFSQLHQWCRRSRRWRLNQRPGAYLRSGAVRKQTNKQTKPSHELQHTFDLVHPALCKVKRGRVHSRSVQVSRGCVSVLQRGGNTHRQSCENSSLCVTVSFPPLLLCLSLPTDVPVEIGYLSLLLKFPLLWHFFFLFVSHFFPPLQWKVKKEKTSHPLLCCCLLKEFKE